MTDDRSISSEEALYTARRNAILRFIRACSFDRAEASDLQEAGIELVRQLKSDGEWTLEGGADEDYFVRFTMRLYGPGEEVPENPVLAAILTET